MTRKRRAASLPSDAEQPRRAIGYVRVSSEDQRDNGLGLEGQEQAIRAFAISQGYTLVGVVADAAVSGATNPLQRPGFQQIIEQAADIDLLLVWKFDRLARDLVYAVATTDLLLRDYDIKLRSVTEPIDTDTPMGRMVFGILAGLAELERENIKARTLMGRKLKAQRGGFAGGRVPYGYRSVDKALVVDPAEAEVVRLIFRLRESGLGVKRIAAELNEHGYRTRRGQRWSYSSVQVILQNPKYRGRVKYFFEDEGITIDTKGTHDSVIP